MARAAAVVAADDRRAGQIQVAQRVEDLVTHELVFVAQAVVIEDAVMTKHHGILQRRSEEHTSELQSLMRISYAVFCLKKKRQTNKSKTNNTTRTIMYK